MKNSYIPEISGRLTKVNHLLKQSAGKETVSFDDAGVLASFYRDFNDTSKLIAEADGLVNRDIDGLSAFALSLFSEVETYLSSDRSRFDIADFEIIFNCHTKPFEKRYKTALEASTALWSEYSAMSNRLDFLPLFSEGYKSLNMECDAKKEEYDTAHAYTDKLYAEWQREASAYFHILYFRMAFMDVLVARLGEIARCIIADISRIKEART